MSDQKRSMDLKTLVYQELVKTEWCIMRFGYPCRDVNGIYLGQGHPNYDVTRGMTLHEILLALVRAYERFQVNAKRGYSIDEMMNDVLNAFSCGNKGGNSLVSFVECLVQQGFLYKFPPSNEVNKIYSYYKSLSTPNNGGPLGDYDVRLLIRVLSTLDSLKQIDLSNILLNVDNYYMEFKTLHGEYVRIMRFSSSLPSRTYSLEAYVLPFISEPIDVPETNQDYSLDKLKDKISDFLGDSPTASLIANLFVDLLYQFNIREFYYLKRFQYEYLSQLLDKDHPKLTIIAAPTGSGKTNIFFLYSILKVISYKLANKKKKVVFIYPRKSLAREQLNALLRLVYLINSNIIEKELGSDKKIRIIIFDGDSPSNYKDKSIKPGKSFRGLSLDNSPIIYKEVNLETNVAGSPHSGSNKILMPVIENTGEKLDFISEVKSDISKTDFDIIVTSVNEFSTAIYRSGRGNFYEKFLEEIGMLIFDEAHVYLEKEAGDYVHYMLLRYMLHELYKRLGDKIKVGGIDQTIRELLEDFEIIFISATLLDRELDEQISLSNIGGIPIKVLDTNKGHMKIEQFLKFLLGGNLYNMFTKLSKSSSKYLYLPYQVNSAFQRLTFPVIVFTSPESKIRTYFTDMIVSSMIIADGLNNRPQGGLKVKTLAFIDNKTAQKEIYQEVLNRHIKEVMSPCDKLLLSDHKPIGRVGGGMEILDLMKQSDKLIYSKDSILYYFSHYHFYDPDVVSLKASEFASKIKDTNSYRVTLDFCNKLFNSIQSDNSEHLLEDKKKVFLAYHNADLEKPKRIEIENKISEFDSYAILSTSTLELGVNVPNVGFILQYGYTISSDSFIQRAGRAGRHQSTFYISLPMIVARNYSTDSILLDEELAFRRLFSLSVNIPDFGRDKITAERYAFLALSDAISYALNTDRNNVQLRTIIKGGDLLRKLLEVFLYLDSSEIKAEEVLKDFNNVVGAYTEWKHMLDEENERFGERVTIEGLLSETISRVLDEINTISMWNWESIKDKLPNEWNNLTSGLEDGMIKPFVLDNIENSLSKMRDHCSDLFKDNKRASNCVKKIDNAISELRKLKRFITTPNIEPSNSEDDYTEFMTLSSVSMPHPSLRRKNGDIIKIPRFIRGASKDLRDFYMFAVPVRTVLGE